MEIDTFTTDDAINAATFNDDGLSWCDLDLIEVDYAEI